MKKTSFILFILSLFMLTSCEDILKEVAFTVATEKTTYTAGEEIIFTFDNAPDWVTFYSGEENKTYPDAHGVAIKSITNELSSYSYKYTAPGIYNIVFVGGNTNYEGKNEQVSTFTLTVN